jgi:hypothetical protein
VWDDAHANAVFAHLNAIRADLDELQATVAGLQGSAVSGAPTAAENALAVLAALRANPLAPK